MELWKEQHKEPKFRYRPLVIYGPSSIGKTELAKSHFSNALVVVVENSLSPYVANFDDEKHDCLIFDNVNNQAFITNNRKLLQASNETVATGQ